jgi:hypothetical protein
MYILYCASVASENTSAWETEVCTGPSTTEDELQYQEKEQEEKEQRK